MQTPYLLTQGRKLHNDSMWKIKEKIPAYKIVVVRTHILNFLTHWHPRGIDPLDTNEPVAYVNQLVEVQDFKKNYRSF